MYYDLAMAEVKVLLKGYLMKDSPSLKGSCSTISLVRGKDLDGNEMVMVVDPGTTVSQDLIIEALKKEGLNVDDVTHVGITHGHMDHYRNISMFKNAINVDHDGIWRKDECEYSSTEEIVKISDDVSTMKTPGHTADSITFLVQTDRGVVAVCGDVFWLKDYPLRPEDDEFGSYATELRESREKVLKMADYIIPGHGEEYEV